MAIMKQIDECLTKAFNNKQPPLSKKWKAFQVFQPELGGWVINLYHYHHLVLVYRVHDHHYLYEWWEKQADKRGLDSAKEWLEERRQKLNS